jgi:ABC-type glutathione transport system ATPase component
MNQIKIKICGHSGSGKTAIGKLIMNTLKNAGIQCEFHDNDEEYINEFPLARALSSIAVKTVVSIEAIQLRDFPKEVITIQEGNQK